MHQSHSENIDSGLQISQQIGDKRSEAYLLCALASKKRIEGKTDESLLIYEKALNIIEETGDLYAKCKVLDNMANTFADSGDYGKAIENYFGAMKLAKTVGDDDLYANISWNLATVYNEQEQYDLATKYMQITVDFEQKINHPNADADLEALNKVRAKIQNIIKPENEK